MVTNREEWNDNKLFLIDAYALIFRAYYAFIRNPLVNSKGQNVSAISGFTSAIYDLIQREKPTHMAVVFDKGQTLRAQEHDFYKANRQETPEDISFSVPYIYEIIRGFKIPILELEGYEADDIIGTIAKRKAKEGHVVFMVTPDKDFAQLVDENIYVYKPGRQGSDVEILGVDEIKAQWEVDSPLQVIDILGMWGDAVDNIPGIPGIGEKTAKKLIKEYGSMENMIANAAAIKGKIGQSIAENAEQGLISKKLATIDIHVPIDVTDSELIIETPDKEKLGAIFAELEFRTLAKRVLGENKASESAATTPTIQPTQVDLFGNAVAAANLLADTTVAIPLQTIATVPHQYLMIDTEAALDELVTKILAASEFCFDTETTGLDYFELEIVGLSFSLEKATAYYIPCNAALSVTTIIEKLRPVFENNQLLKIGQNIKFDWHVLKKYGIEVMSPLYDTMLAHYVAEPDLKHGMDYLSETYLGYKPISIEELIGKKGKNQGNMIAVALDKITDYAAEDADVTFQLKQVIAPIVTDRGVDEVLQKIELPLIPVLAEMERSGVKIDVSFLNEYGIVLGNEIAAYQQKIYDLAGLQFNIDSPKQMGDILFKHLRLPQDKKTATGQASTNEAVLAKLADEYPIAAQILEYRELAKLKSTYVDALPALVNSYTDRVHTTFNQTIAATGRLSSINPNLQNIPIRTDRGKKIREAFITDSDKIMLSADYSQIELRLVAEMSGDEGMIAAFKNNLDIHAATAAKVYGVAYDAVTKEMRYKAKSVNFGIIYGQGAFGLAQNIGSSRTEAKEIIDNYFKEFPRIKEYMSNTIQFAQQHGYVKTMMGRRRYLPDINSKNFTVRGFAERNAINAPVQGSAADMIKLAMIGIHSAFKKQNIQSKMLLQVHDELVFEVLPNEKEEVKSIISHNMINAIKTTVPIAIEIGEGKNWLEAH